MELPPLLHVVAYFVGVVPGEYLDVHDRGEQSDGHDGEDGVAPRLTAPRDVKVILVHGQAAVGGHCQVHAGRVGHHYRRQPESRQTCNTYMPIYGRSGI